MDQKDGITELESDFYYIDRAEEAITERREKFDEVEGVLDKWIFEKRENLEHWKVGREALKLQEEADKAQHYAGVAMDVAVDAIENAEFVLARTKSYATTASSIGGEG